MQKSLQMLTHVADFAERRQHLESLKSRFLALQTAAITDSYAQSDGQRARAFVETFSQLDRATDLHTLYENLHVQRHWKAWLSRQQPLLEKLAAIGDEEAATQRRRQLLLDLLAEFFLNHVDQSLLGHELTWATHVFGEAHGPCLVLNVAQDIVARLALTDEILGPLGETFAELRPADAFAFLISLKQKVLEPFMRSVERRLAAAVKQQPLSPTLITSLQKLLRVALRVLALNPEHCGGNVASVFAFLEEQIQADAAQSELKLSALGDDLNEALDRIRTAMEALERLESESLERCVALCGGVALHVWERLSLGSLTSFLQELGTLMVQLFRDKCTSRRLARTEDALALFNVLVRAAFAVAHLSARFSGLHKKAMRFATRVRPQEEAAAASNSPPLHNYFVDWADLFLEQFETDRKELDDVLRQISQSSGALQSHVANCVTPVQHSHMNGCSLYRLHTGVGGGLAVRTAVQRTARKRLRRARGSDRLSARVAREAGGARLEALDAAARRRQRAAGLLVRTCRVRHSSRRVPSASAAASRPHLYVNIPVLYRTEYATGYTT